ncbi:MAG: hypothetical protein EPO65_00940 [Dehalococcoidia bacterium]|nr:MAG: hypothetical protein EPO65_00940 [Dehalococcoidia bacterium]
MPWPFGKAARPSTDDTRFIAFCQLLIAYQQHAMEVFNGAGAAAAGKPPQADFIAPYSVQLHDPDRVRALLIPAMEKKRAILKEMKRVHRDFGVPTLESHQRVYHLMGNLIDVLEARAEEQQRNLDRLVSNLAFHPADVTSAETDQNERMASVSAISALNGLVSAKGLAGEPLLNISWTAFNEARAHSGLPALSKNEFRRRYLAVLAGQRALLFSDD